MTAHKTAKPAALGPGARVRLVYDGSRGVVQAWDPCVGMYAVRLDGGGEDYALPGDVQPIGRRTAQECSGGQQVRARSKSRRLDAPSPCPVAGSRPRVHIPRDKRGLR